MRRPRGKARPPEVLRPKERARILELIGKGVAPYPAASAAGVCRDAFAKFLRMARDAVDKPGDLTPAEVFGLRFLADLELAAESTKAKLVELVFDGAQKDPRIGLEILARRWPEEWGRSDRVDVGITAGDSTRPPVIPAEIQERMKRIAARAVEEEQ